VEAAYRQAENRITYARRQESYYRDREKTDTEWFQRRTVSLLRILDKVYGDPYAAKSAWDVLEKKHGVAEAEKLVRDNPHVLGKVRGLRIGDKRDAARAEAKRMSQYLGGSRATDWSTPAARSSAPVSARASPSATSRCSSMPPGAGKTSSGSCCRR
jgi:hypothetical protein